MKKFTEKKSTKIQKQNNYCCWGNFDLYFMISKAVPDIVINEQIAHIIDVERSST